VALQTTLHRINAFAALYESGDALAATGRVIDASFDERGEAGDAFVALTGVGATGSVGTLTASGESPTSVFPPGILLPALVTLGEKTSEGHLIELVAPPWFRIAELAQRDPSALLQLDWRLTEELVAGAYAADGYDVILTPRSGDGGRDVIATKQGIGSVRIFDQVKRYAPGHLVPANDVRAMVGVLDLYDNVSKAVITTTLHFAPGVLTDENIRRFMPYRLDLRPLDRLVEMLREAAAKRDT
jgi:restriction system protein